MLAAQWWMFDATRQADLAGLIRIGVGRDAAEIAFASPFGELKFGPVNITIERTSAPELILDRTIDPISTEEPALEAGSR